MNEREVGKIEKYKVFKDEIARMCGMKEVIVIPVVVKTTLLATTRILRLVLEC